MDPDETLRLFRQRYAKYSAMFDRAEDVEGTDGLSGLSDLNEAVTEELEFAAGHAHDLFEWLAKGGFAPDWTTYTREAGTR
jgi:hypothetical protein